MKLHAVFRKNDNGTWDATVEFHPYILVERAPCLDSAKEMLNIYIAEEMAAKGKRCNWVITKQSVI